MAFDIIGDIHGMVGPLEALLESMGYSSRKGAYRHPEGRTAIFVGDLIDRGVHGLEVVEIARSMQEAGQAIVLMGNHELNAIFFKTEDHYGYPLRDHTQKNIEQHSSFLSQIAMDPYGQDKWSETIEWFKSLPLFYENDDFRVVHACWDQKSIDLTKKFLNPNNSLNESYLERAALESDELFKAIEKILKGDEQPLPDGINFKDKSGHQRYDARLRWWLDKNATFQDLVMFQGSKEVVQNLKNQMPSTKPKGRVVYKSQKPVFIGHYWMTGNPEIQNDKVCCVDYSVGKGDKLVAYRWDSGALSNENFVFEKCCR